MKAAGTAGPVDNENKEQIRLTVYNFTVGKLVFYPSPGGDGRKANFVPRALCVLRCRRAA